MEFTDFLDELPPDVQAEFEEMQEAMTDPEMMEMFEGMEGMEESGSDQP